MASYSIYPIVKSRDRKVALAIHIRHPFPAFVSRTVNVSWPYGRLYDILGGITSPMYGHLGWFLGRRVFRTKGRR